MLRSISIATVLLLAATGTAGAGTEPVRVLDAGEEVIVIARGISAATDEVRDYSDRIDVELAGDPEVLTERFGDDTVKRVDIRGDRRRSLSIQLRHGRSTTDGIARGARVAQIGDDLQVVLPRDPSQAAATTEPTGAAAEPTPEPATAIPGGPAPVEPTTTQDTAASAEAAQPTAEQPAAVGAMAEEPEPKTEEEAPAALREPADSDDGNSSGLAGVALGVLALGAGGALVWHLRRKGGVVPGADRISVVASKPLGPKTRVVWLSAGHRDLLLTVGNGNAQVLSQWSRGDADAPAREPAPSTVPTDEDHPTARADLPRARVTSSPAVNGLLELRKQRAVSEHVATDDVDADAAWARELLLATRGGNRS